MTLKNLKKKTKDKRQRAPSIMLIEGETHVSVVC